MSLEQFSNNATTTLGSSVPASGSGSTTITVATGSGALFPAITSGQFFSATLFSPSSSSITTSTCEIVYVTARSGDTMTVVRAREGTTAQAWGVGTIFANFPTAAFFNNTTQSADVQSQTGNYAADTGTANAGVASLSPTPASLSAIQGSAIRILKITSANTGAYTLNLNGFGTKSVTQNGSAIQANQLPASTIFQVVWDGTNFELLSAPALIYNSNLAPMGANTVKANLTGSGASPSDVSVSSLLSGLGFGAYSLTPSGYYTFPNGFILQWGNTGYIYSESSASVSFPIAFPNACLNAGATIVIPSASNFYDQGAQIVGTPGKTGMTVFLQQYDGSGHNYPVSVYWFALGY